MTDYRLMQVKNIAEYCRPSLSYHMPLSILRGRLRQVLQFSATDIIWKFRTATLNRYKVM